MSISNSISDCYDAEFGTQQNAQDVSDAIKNIVDRINNTLGEQLVNIVLLAQDTNNFNSAVKFELTERELRIIRFSLNRALESI